MIPKQIFFFWCGENIPKYVEYAINAYKNVNTSFSVDLIQINKNEILNKLSNTNLSKHTKYIRNIVIHEYARKHIEKYGGFFVHADTIPLKPFDDLVHLKNIQSIRLYPLFNINEFKNLRLLNNNDVLMHVDDILIAAEKNCNIYLSNKNYIYIERFNTNFAFFTDNKNKNDKILEHYKKEAQLFRQRREAFFNCTLKIDDISKYTSYIEHYEANTNDINNGIPGNHYCCNFI